MSEQEERQIIEDYTKNGLTLQDLMCKYHHKYNMIAKILDKYNIKHDRSVKKLGRPNPKNRVELTEYQKQIILDMYVTKKRGQVACAKAAGVTQYIVKRFLVESGIKIRNYSEAAIESNMARRKYNINDSYFDKESSNMAYILGFLVADGSISKCSNEIKIGLSATDKDFLSSIAKELNSNREIKEYINSDGFSCCEWHFTSKKIKDKLAEYNIIPAKTFCFKFPEKLNRKYWIDFIRGYFDGDGCVSTAGKSAIRWQVCSATKDVLQHIIDFFYEEYNIPKVCIYERKGKNITYYIQYSTVPTREIYKHLYTKNSLYLPRKKKKFEEIL